jgi:L-iditol 2-dehydrogenase
MRAGYYVGNYTYEVRTLPDREPAGNEVKIEVAWCGLCGTDIHKFHGRAGAGVVHPPIILGHECSGIVTAVGSDCRHFKPGDRVACNPSWGCGRCKWCKDGFPNFCIERKGVAKGFSDYVFTPEENVYHIDDRLDLLYAAFTEPLSCVLHGLDLIKPGWGCNIVMYGMGAIGGLMLQLLKKMAPKNLIVVEREEEKRKLAKRLGATEAVTDREIEKLAAGINVDYVIECIGLNATMEQAVRIAGKGAKVLLFGLGEPGNPMRFDQYEAYLKELSIYTSYLNPHTTGRAISILESGELDLDSLISAKLDLEDMGEELSTQRYSSKGKVMVKLSGKR